MKSSLLITEYLQPQDYAAIFKDMAEFTANRKNAVDQIWVLEHNPVYTHGLASQVEHVLTKLPYQAVQSDRGGQVTFHGPGQLVCYLMIDLQQKGLTITDLINNIEKAIIATLRDFNIIANTENKIGRGVFVNKHKIAFVGLKIKNKCSYHGFSLNIDNDLTPYNYINPCGITDLKLTTVKDHLPSCNKEQITVKILDHLCNYFDYSQVTTRKL